MNQKQLHEQIAAMLMHQNGILQPPGGPRPASRDSRGVSAEDRDDLEEEKGLSMQLGMQMDMANLLRSQFNASMPTQVRMMESGGLEMEMIRNPFAGLPRPESWTEHGLGGSECWQAQPSSNFAIYSLQRKEFHGDTDPGWLHWNQNHQFEAPTTAHV